MIEKSMMNSSSSSSKISPSNKTSRNGKLSQMASSSSSSSSKIIPIKTTKTTLQNSISASSSTSQKDGISSQKKAPSSSKPISPPPKKVSTGIEKFFHRLQQTAATTNCGVERSLNAFLPSSNSAKREENFMEEDEDDDDDDEIIAISPCSTSSQQPGAAQQRETTQKPLATPPKRPSAEHQLKHLSLTKIRNIMEHSPSSNEGTRINGDAVQAMATAAEGFIAILAQGAYKHANALKQPNNNNNKNLLRIDYNHLSTFAHSNDDLEVIHDILPRKQRFAEVLKLMKKNQQQQGK